MMFEILRHTLVPSATVEEGAIGWPFLEIVYAMMSGNELNLLDLMVNRMLDCKQNVRAPLALQPYIMALVLHTVEDFYGLYEIQHRAFLPYRRDEAFLDRLALP